LAKLGDNIYATSAFCTHYGAQLANGVLVKDGRIVWYADPVTPFFHLHLGPNSRAARGTEVWRPSDLQRRQHVTGILSVLQRSHWRHRRRSSTCRHTLLQNQRLKWEDLCHRRRRACLETEHVTSAQGPGQP
jgi:hypothetical protein